MTTDTKVLRADRFTEIGEIIQRDVGVITDRWCQKALQEQAQAKRVHHQELLDHLPSFLAELGKGLVDSGNPYNCRHFPTAIQHGEQRWETGWSLSEVVRDYQILRLVVLDYLDSTLDRPLRMREILAIGLVIDEGIEASVARFMQFCEDSSQQQAEALRSADRKKNEFLAVLAHELRNPLAPLRNSVDVLRVNRSDPTVVDQVREIMERQVKQMTRLVDDMLDISRIALGKLELRKERVDLRTILTQVVQTTSSLAHARRQSVALDLPQEAIWVEADQSRLLQVFVNLLNNAVKYTQDGGRLRIQVCCEGQEALVRVQDNGVGIPADMLSKIFDLFTQIDLRAERVQCGLGIGLALVKQLVELHGGKITAKSDGPNRGSEFIISLPRIDGKPTQIPEQTDKVRTHAGRRILLIEDNADARNSLALLLKLVGHDVIAAQDGQSGIEAAASSAPDFALIDIGLPDLDGYQVAAKLRGMLGPQPVLIALTGFSQPEDRQRALEAGFQNHLTKPVELKTIQSLLATYSRDS